VQIQQAGAALAQYDFLKELPWLKTEVLGNAVYAYFLTLVTFLVIFVLLQTGLRYVVRHLDRLANAGEHETFVFVRDLLADVSSWVVVIVAAYVASRRLGMPTVLDRGVRLVALAAVIWQAVRLSSDLSTYLITRTRLLGHGSDPVLRSTSHNIAILAKAGLWTAGVLFFLGNAGFDVSTFIAGLGIGGVAIALAAQAILGDTFSSFAIALDRPFEVGDFIIVDDLLGVVEHIGLKTTRLRSLSGELLVFANSDLTKSRIKNYKHMRERRIVFQIRTVYDTPLEKVRLIPEMLADAVRSQKAARLDRSHFASYGEFALVFEVVYYVTAADYNVYMDTQQAINLLIYERFAAAGIALAYPTRTMVLPRSGALAAASASSLAAASTRA